MLQKTIACSLFLTSSSYVSAKYTPIKINEFIARLKAFSHMRKTQKKKGRSNPSKKDLEHLFDKSKILMEKAIDS